MAKGPEEMQSAKPVTEMITYLPGPMDPAHVKWGGHTFHANVGKEIAGRPDGTTTEKLNHEIIEAARSNRHFQVGNAKPKRERAGQPTTAKEYRAHLVAWLKEPNIEHAEDLIRRLASERELQAACEVGADDYAYIATLFMPRLFELAKADELSEQQVAALWINLGYNQLPWAE